MNDRTLIDRPELERQLATRVGWQLEPAGGAIHRTLTFPDFETAFAFMTRVALAAEREGHHPEWTNTYNRVHIRLWTHDRGGVTALDLRLADAVDRAAGLLS